MTRLGFVTGLRREAAILETASRDLPDAMQPLLYCGGAHADRAHAGALSLIEAGAGALVSFGIAGGLVPELPAGSLILASTIQILGKASLEVDLKWRDRLCQRIGANIKPQLGEMVGSHVVVQTTDDKARLFDKTQCLAVDMESHAVARVASEHALPFLVVRAIADTAAMAIPNAALAGIGTGGETRAFAALRQATLVPWEWPALLRLGGAHQKALSVLRRTVYLAGVDLAYE